MSLRYLLAAVALVVASSSESCTSDDDTCSSLPTPGKASALLQVDTKSHQRHHVHAHHQNEPAASEKLHMKLVDTQAEGGKTLSGLAKLISQAAVHGFCTGHPCRASLLQESPSHHSHLGKSSTLSQAGYEKVASLKDDTEMKDFMERVIEQYDCKVEKIGGLMGIVPWFSGTTLTQDMEKLENTLLNAVLSEGKSESWISFKNSAQITGDSAQLSFVGYVQVAAIKSDEEMEKFGRRTCKDMGVKIVDDGGFTGMIKYYSGTDNFQSFERLQAEVKSAANAPHSWAQWDKSQSDTPSKPSKSSGNSLLALGAGSGFSLLALRGERGFCKDFPCRATFRSSSSSLEPSLLQHASNNVDSDVELSEVKPKQEEHEHNGLGKRATLDQAGYKQVADLKSDVEMTAFIHRVIEKYDFKVEEEAGLAGIVPWFSGATTVQDMEQLENTVLYAVLTSSKKPWITYKNSNHVRGDTAELNFVGYVKIAAMKDDAQMQMFARRVCDKLGITIENKDGFAGMVRYYSGTDNFQSFDKLQTEIKSAATAPNSWASSKSGAQKVEASSKSDAEHEHEHEHERETPATVQTMEQTKASGGGAIGDTADLNFQGYVRVASSRNGDEMKKFARRVCLKLGLTIVDQGGFEGMVRFFVGPENFQSYEKLESDIKEAAKKNSWCKHN